MGVSALYPTGYPLILLAAAAGFCIVKTTLWNRKAISH